jgi:hypothetical protein
VLGWHATGDGPSTGGASEIRGTLAEGERERENDQGFKRGINELSGKVLKTHMIW